VNENVNAGESTANPEAVAQEPKVLQQHEINALVGGAKQKGFEKGYQQAKAELMQNGMGNAAPAAQPVASQNVQMPSQLQNEATIRQIAQDEFNRKQQESQAVLIQQQNVAKGQEILNSLKTKSTTAASKYDDFNKVVDPDFNNFANAPEVLMYANMTDNPGEVLYDLAKNPMKIANLVTLHRLQMGPQAFTEIKKLSDSIKVNEMSGQQPKPKAPLSQISPSTVGVGKTDEDSYTNSFKGKY
jgi:hypothetical protein